MTASNTANEPEPQQLTKQGHIFVATWGSESQKLQKTVIQTLEDNNHTFSVIQDAVTPESLVNQVRDEDAHIIACLAQTVVDRRHIYRLMAFLHRRRWSIPVILIGEAVDPQYAQILALPEHGDLYTAGVYYCEDENEMIQVLKQIILYTPPPVYHEHDHGEDDPFSCSSCSSCGDACSLNLAM